MKENMFEFILAFHVKPIPGVPWRILESRFRKALDFKKQGTLRVTIEGVSSRYLKVCLKGTPKLKVDVDPNGQKYGLLLVQFVAAFPRWCEDDKTLTYTTEEDTRVSGTEEGSFKISNPTNNEIWLKWVCQGGNAGIEWTLPDFSFEDDRWDRAESDADRMVDICPLALNENITVDTDEMTMEGQVNSDLDTQVYQRMSGREFLYPIPPYTDPIDLPFFVQGADIGNVLQVRMPRQWSRPWGLE
jgi:hypothetical protein